MMDANKVVEQTLRNEEAHAGAAFDVSEHPTYATNTMAELLASQGSTAQAEALRQALSPARSGTPTGPDAPRVAEAFSDESAEMGPRHVARLRVIATLESWLHNVRRNAERDTSHGAVAASGAANPSRGAQ